MKPSMFACFHSPPPCLVRLPHVCAAGARAVGTRRGDGPSRGLAPNEGGWGQQMVGEVVEGPQPLRRCLFGGETLQM